jgi:hypothetical protein
MESLETSRSKWFELQPMYGLVLLETQELGALVNAPEARLRQEAGGEVLLGF